MFKDLQFLKWKQNFKVTGFDIRRSLISFFNNNFSASLFFHQSISRGKKKTSGYQCRIS